MVNKVTGTHKPGEYIVHLDVANQGRLAELMHYYELPKPSMLDSIICRGIADLLIQIRLEQSQNRRDPNANSERDGFEG